MRRKIGFFVLTLAALLAAAIAALATPFGRSIVAGIVERAASTSGLTVSIEGTSGWPPFWFGAEKIWIADAEGPAIAIDNLRLDMRLMGLLRGTIVVDDIEADRVTVARRPVLSSDGEDGGAALPFTVERFAIAALDLSEAVAGRQAVLAVQGSASTSASGALALDVAAERTDGIEGTLSASLSRRADQSWFSADVALKEAANGILVGLMGRDVGPAYALSAQAGPAGEGMRGTISLSSSDAAQFSGQFALASGGEATRVTLRGSGDLADLVPPDYSDLLSGAIDIGFDADWASGQGTLPKLDIRQGTLRTATVDGSVSGELGDNVADLTLKVAIANPSGAAIELPMFSVPTEIERASFNGTVAPSNGVVRLQMTGNIAGLTAGEIAAPATGLSLAVESDAADALAANSLPFALRVESQTIRTAEGEIGGSSEQAIILTAEGTIDTETLSAQSSAELRLPDGTASFNGTIALDAATGSLSAQFTDIREVAALFRRDMSGGVDGTLEGRFFGENGTDLQAAARLTDLDPGIDTARRLLNGQSTFRAQVASDGGVHSISGLSFSARDIETTGSATVEDGNVNASLEGTISDLSVLADRSSGAATFSADISGALPYPAVDARLQVAVGNLVGQSIENATASVQGQPSDSGWAGTLTVDGSFADKPLSGSTEFAVVAETGQITLPNVDLTIADNRITGALEGAGGRLLSGELDVDAPNLTALSALALSDIGGSATARVRFVPDGDRQTITVSFDGSDISYASFNAANANGTARVVDAFSAPLVSGEATVSNVEAGSVRLDRITANAAVVDGATQFDVAAKGPDVDLTTSGALTSQAGDSLIRLDTMTGSAFRLPVNLADPVSIRLGGGEAGITNAALSIGGGRVVVNGTASPRLDLTVVATSVPASVANGFAPNLGARGTVNGRATVSGELSTPNISWQADWTGLQTAATVNAGLPALQLSASGNATRSQTDIRGTVSGAGLSLGINGSAPYSGSGLAIAVNGSAPLALLALQSARELRLAGTANLDLNVTGSAQSPRIAGNVNLANATVVDTDSGFGVNGVSGRIVLNGQRATVERLSGRLAQGGQVTVTGTVDIAAARFPANLTVRVENGRYNDGRVINALFNANLAVNGPLAGGGTLSGTVALGRTEIQLPDRLSGSATAIDVRHINTEPGFRPPQLRQPDGGAGRSASGSLRLAIDITNSGGIFVRGFGVDSEFGGALRLTNTVSDPVAAGAFQMRWGRIEFLGRRFQLDSGTLTFSGDLVPVVNFTASTSTSTAAIEVHVVGPANDPTISFTSNPDLPQEEILSSLLFDRQVSRLSPVQAAQLVDAAAQLSGVGGGAGIFASVRQALGVDDLDIRQGTSGGTVVGIGKRINENLRLGVEAGSGVNGGRVTIDLNITPNLKLQGAAGGSEEIGLTYEREY